MATNKGPDGRAAAQTAAKTPVKKNPPKKHTPAKTTPATTKTPATKNKRKRMADEDESDDEEMFPAPSTKKVKGDSAIKTKSTTPKATATGKGTTPASAAKAEKGILTAASKASTPVAKKAITPATKKTQSSREPDEDDVPADRSHSKTTPTTGSRKRKTPVAISSGSESEEEDNDDDYDEQTGESMQMVVFRPNTTVRGTARKRNAPKKPVLAKQSIPRSYAECGEADKALVDMRDAGEEWDAIATKYAEISGITTDCKSTLPNRYSRMKTNFVTMNDEDAIILFQAKIEIDKQMADELWGRVAEKVEELGGMPYTADALFRNWKRLCLAGDPVAVKSRENQLSIKDTEENEETTKID
ncbi:Hypothetical protein D9617_18g032880 [Elsinoe fawcettii]|nr:Hypothetical protein D9617_18g032880 [Elsinoe fawcettii]